MVTYNTREVDPLELTGSVSVFRRSRRVTLSGRVPCDKPLFCTQVVLLPVSIGGHSKGHINLNHVYRTQGQWVEWEAAMLVAHHPRSAIFTSRKILILVFLGRAPSADGCERVVIGLTMAGMHVDRLVCLPWSDSHVLQFSVGGPVPLLET